MPKKYKVVFLATLVADLEASYEWGVDEWGEILAERWLQKIKGAMHSLSQLPMRHPIAPENDQFEVEVRHLVHERYRILYTVSGSEVHVLHCRTGVI